MGANVTLSPLFSQMKVDNRFYKLMANNFQHKTRCDLKMKKKRSFLFQKIPLQVFNFSQLGPPVN